MPTRTIYGLKFSRQCPPVHARVHGASVPKRLGLAYENLVGEALPKAIRGPWFGFADANGRGCCQPDFLLLTPNGLLVLEVKLTYSSTAWTQLNKLYLPVLRWWLDHEVGAPAVSLRGVQICKKTSSEWPSEATGYSLDEVGAEGPALVHWLGHTPLTTQSVAFPEGWLDRALLPDYTKPIATRARRSSLGKTHRKAA